jgi:hypothetical protein
MPDREFAEDGAGETPSQVAFDPVVRSDNLHFAGENSEQRTLVSTLVRGPFTGSEMEVGRCPRKALELGLLERREQRYCADVINGQHGSSASWILATITYSGMTLFPLPGATQLVQINHSAAQRSEISGPRPRKARTWVR